LHAGPTVQMIFARRSARRLLEAADGSTATSSHFGTDFPFFKFVPVRIYVGLIIVYGEHSDS
jgi:hypothetical protein